MGIIGSKNYLIKIEVGEGFERKQFIGNFTELRAVIATTWAQVPHRVTVKDLDILVQKEGSEDVLAWFKFEPFEQYKLPDHF